MAAPLNINLGMNTREVAAGAAKAADAIEDVTDSLDDLARASRKSGDEFERAGDDLEDSMRDARRETEKTERSFKDLGRAADRAGDEGKDGLRKVGDAGEEVSGELRQNLGETFSSFRGDLEDLPQIAQDTLGGLAGSGALGGIPGLIATAAGAAGIGLLINAFDEASEAQERLKEKSTDWAQTFIENGSKVLTSAQIVAKGNDILNNSYDEMTENAKLWGVSEETALAAMAGSPAAIDEVTKSMERKKKAAEEDAIAAQKAAEANGGTLLTLTPLEQEYAKGRDRLNEVTQAMKNGADQADTYSYFLRDLAQNTEGATTKVDEFGDTVTSLPDGTQIYIDAETGQATTDINAIEKKIYGVPTSRTTKFYGLTELNSSQATIDRFMSRNNGRSFTMYGRVKVDAGGDWD